MNIEEIEILLNDIKIYLDENKPINNKCLKCDNKTNYNDCKICKSFNIYGYHILKYGKYKNEMLKDIPINYISYFVNTLTINNSVNNKFAKDNYIMWRYYDNYDKYKTLIRKNRKQDI